MNDEMSRFSTFFSHRIIVTWMLVLRKVYRIRMANRILYECLRKIIERVTACFGFENFFNRTEHKGSIMKDQLELINQTNH